MDTCTIVEARLASLVRRFLRRRRAGHGAERRVEARLDRRRELVRDAALLELEHLGVGGSPLRALAVLGHHEPRRGVQEHSRLRFKSHYIGLLTSVTLVIILPPLPGSELLNEVLPVVLPVITAVVLPSVEYRAGHSMRCK